MNNATLSLIALVGGLMIPLGMLAKYATELVGAYRMSRHPKGEYLELFVNGKDYSTDLRTITNGGSERIQDARRELERCA
jgi:hypothetical protein